MVRGKLQRILYVEDEEDIRLIAQMALRELGGFDVFLCSSGKEAFEKVDEIRPQMILLDVMMPEMDGLAVFERLKEMNLPGDPPIVFVTAKIQSNDLKEYLQKGAAAIIKKPFDPTKLADQVRRVWEGGEFPLTLFDQ